MLLAVLVWLAATAAHALQTIRVYRVGSSSFGAELLDNTRYLLEAGGAHTLVYDSAGYTRLDDFVTKPYTFHQWTNTYLPVIMNGAYDYVVFQTIGWFNLTPEQHQTLLTEILPLLVSNVHLSGARVVLYDKYVALLRNEGDPLARAWAGRYPYGVYLNNLLHIAAAKQAGVDAVTFGGAAVHQLWDVPYYGALRFLYNDSGHPGTMAHYLSACGLAHAFTGIVPTGSMARAVKMAGWHITSFNNLPYGDAAAQALYAANSNRVVDGHLLLHDVEATNLQYTAMDWHLDWNARIVSNLHHEAAWSFTTAEIARIYRDITNYAAYNLSPAAIDSLNAQFMDVDEGVLTSNEVQQIFNTLNDYGATVRNYANQFLLSDDVKQLQRDYRAYWAARNSKFRDDVYFEGLYYQKLLEKGTNTAEIVRVQESVGVHGNVLNLAGMKLLLERITPEQRNIILSSYAWGGARKRYNPTFYDAQMAATGDWQRLIAVYEAYFMVWDDPNLMDRLKGTQDGQPPRDTNCFLKEVWLEADSLFREPGALVADTSTLHVPENGTNAFALKVTQPPGANVTLTVSVARISASFCDIVVTAGAPCYFTSANWNEYQPVTLMARDDAGHTDGSALFRCTASDGTTLDITAHEMDDDKLPPATPGAAAPASGATHLPLRPVLQATAFSDPNPGDTHDASQWQISTNESFTAIVWDSGSDTEHLTAVTAGELGGGWRCYWRVRYRDGGGLWSACSPAAWFETDPALSRPPVAQPDSFTLYGNGPYSIAAPGVLANDSDPDGDTLSAIKAADPAHGVLVLNADGSFAYTPDEGWPGTDSFSYYATDGMTNSAVTVCHLQAGVDLSEKIISDYFDCGIGQGALTAFTTANTNGWAAHAWSGDTFPWYLGGNASLQFKPGPAESSAYSNWLQGGVLRASNLIGTVTRNLSTPLDGTVWISMVMSSRWWNAVPGTAYPENANGCRILINGSSSNTFGAAASGTSTRRRWLVTEHGVLTTNDITAVAGDDTVLLVARLRTDYSGSADDITLWLFSTNSVYPNGRTVAALGPPVYTSSAAHDLWGSAITSIGLRLRSQNALERDFYIDSLRISPFTVSDDLCVYEVLAGATIPEPALFLFGSAAMMLWRRQRVPSPQPPYTVTHNMRR